MHKFNVQCTPHTARHKVRDPTRRTENLPFFAGQFSVLAIQARPLQGISIRRICIDRTVVAESECGLLHRKISPQRASERSFSVRDREGETVDGSVLGR